MEASLKSQFPIFENKPGLIYLDNASTTQKPQIVIDRLKMFYEKYNANVHRGLYPLSEDATEIYEEARRTVADFINAEPEEIIFTSGTTDSINLLAQMLERSKMLTGASKVLLSDLEHHSNILPWQSITENIDFIKLNKNFELDTSALDEAAPDLVSLSLVSNVTGSIAPAKDIFEQLVTRNNKLVTILDAAQAIGHMPIDVKELDVDFMAFSGHKMYGPMGIGVLYGKKELLGKLEPVRVGGGMIKEVTRNKATWAPLPQKFEAGTPNVEGAMGLMEAIEFINDLDFKNIINHEQELRRYLLSKLQEIDAIEIYHPDSNTYAGSVVSFSIEGIHAHDIADSLGKSNICVRAGHHCCQILHREVLEISASTRVSFGVYNTKEDVDKFITGLEKSVKIFTK